jgi:hypothetical protein
MDKLLRRLARPAVRASTVWEREDRVKHRARLAARASTGREREDPLKHHARRVPRTRPRLLEAVLVSPVFAAQATVGTPAQGFAQRVREARTNLQ